MGSVRQCRRLSTSALRWTFDVYGRDAATDPGDHRQGWLMGGVRLPVNRPGRNVNEVTRAGIDVTVMVLELEA